MPRLLTLVAAVAAVVVLPGCGREQDPPPPSVAAPPQQAELGWDERAPSDGPATLVFDVHRLAVTREGWEADVEIENRTDVAWRLGDDRAAVGRSFGVMLFATGELDEVERRGREDDLPGLRPARRFAPPLPARLAADRSWRGTVSATGRLAAGRYLRVVFGPLVAVGEPPDGMPASFVWITDHAYLLRP